MKTTISRLAPRGIAAALAALSLSALPVLASAQPADATPSYAHPHADGTVSTT